jgi:Spy/CpxP family protein refolding chaperone
MTKCMHAAPVLFAAAALLVGSGYCQDIKKDGLSVGKLVIPPGWDKLDIGAEQKKKLYAVLGSYQAKMAVLQDRLEQLGKQVANLKKDEAAQKDQRDQLNKQLDSLKKDEVEEAYKLLSDDQKATLKKILADKAAPGKDNKKLP